MEQLRKMKSRADKDRLFESILNDDRATTLFKTDKAKELNNFSSSVSFLLELRDATSADAIVQFKKRWVIADFKYSVSSRYNTIAEDLRHGFKQADVVVLKMKDVDLSIFQRVIDQLHRKEAKSEI